VQYVRPILNQYCHTQQKNKLLQEGNKENPGSGK